MFANGQDDRIGNPERAFPPEEYAARVAKMREQADGRVLLLSNPGSIFYATGVGGLGHFAAQAAVIPPDDGSPVALIARAMEIPTMEVQAPEAERIVYVDSHRPAPTFVEALRSAGAESKGVGIELSTTRADIALEILRDIPRLRWSDTSTLVPDLQAIKSPLEIAYVRKAAAGSVAALEPGMGAVHVGASELDVANAIRSKLYPPGIGAKDPGFPVFVRSAGRISFEHLTASDRLLEEGDPVLMELSSSSWFYCGPLGRIFYVGKAPARLAQVAERVRAGMEAIVRVAVPGAMASDVYRAWVAATGGDRHHCGYIFGLGFYGTGWAGPTTPVGFRPEPDFVLQAGMTFHAMSALIGRASIFGGEMPYWISNSVVVTADGCEVLTPAPETLVLAA